MKKYLIIAACSLAMIGKAQQTKNLFTDFVQIAIITPNADSTAKQLAKAFNLGSYKLWKYKSEQLLGTTYNNVAENWTMNLGIGWVNDVQFEIIEPTGGKTVYADYLNANNGKQGIQHLLFVKNKISYTEAKQKLTEIGFAPKQEGRANAGFKFMGINFKNGLPQKAAMKNATVFTYTSTFDKLKLDIEVSQFPPGFSARSGLKAAIPEYWINGDKKHFEKLPDSALFTSIKSVVVLTKNINNVVAEYKKIFPEININVTEIKMESGLIKSAIIILQNHSIEMVEPISGNTFYSQLLNEKGEGIKLLKVVNNNELSDKRKNEIYTEKGLTNIGTENRLVLNRIDLPFAIELTK